MDLRKLKMKKQIMNFTIFFSNIYSTAVVYLVLDVKRGHEYVTLCISFSYSILNNFIRSFYQHREGEEKEDVCKNV